MTEPRDIGWRLENWARVMTAHGPRVASSQTGAICDRLRRAVEGTAPISGERRSLDEADAWAIERGMPQLETKHRVLLWWCYIQNVSPEVVCRKMGIRHKPATEFVDTFRAAQAAIECIVANQLEKHE